MKKTIFAIGIVCATMMAAAQSNARQDSSAQVTGVASPRDVATGQASGKRMHKPMTVNESTEGLPKQNIVHRDLAAREAATGMATGRASVQTARETGSGMATGKTMAADDWNAQQTTAPAASDDTGSQPAAKLRESPSKASLGKTSVAADTNTKHKNSMTGANSNPMYQESGNSGTNPLYEGSSRKATKTRSNIQNNRVATGDVDGDGTADSAVVKSKSNITNNRAADSTMSPNPAPAQMKGDFSRGHQPDRKAVNDGKTDRESPSGLATGKSQQN